MLSIVKDWRSLFLTNPELCVTPMGEFIPYGFTENGDINDIEIFMGLGKPTYVCNYAYISKIHEFINLENDIKNKYDCTRFALCISGLLNSSLKDELSKQEISKIFDEKLEEIYESEFDSLKSGEMIVLAEQELIIEELKTTNRICKYVKIHSAIYLECDLFISKLGFEGRVVITSFETIQRIYPFLYIYRIRKN